MPGEPDDVHVEPDDVIVEVDGPIVDLEDAGGDDPAISRPTLAASLRDNGFDLPDDATDDDVIARMEELESAAEERDRLREEHANLQAWMKRQQATPAKPAQPVDEGPVERVPDAPKPPPVPEWNDSWESFLERDDRGNIIVRKEYRGLVDPSLPEKYTNRKRWEHERLQSLLSKSDSLFDESRFDAKLKDVEERAYQRAIEEIEKKQALGRQQSSLEKLATDNPWLYDASGNLTALGQSFDQRLSAHLQRGHSPEDAFEYAKFDIQRQTGQTPWNNSTDDETVASPAMPSPAEKKMQLRRRHTNGVNRIAPAPVSRKRGAVGDSGKANSIRQLAGSWRAALEQEAGASE